MDEKKNSEIKFYFFPTFRKIIVGGFVNQLIKNSGLTVNEFRFLVVLRKLCVTQV